MNRKRLYVTPWHLRYSRKYSTSMERMEFEARAVSIFKIDVIQDSMNAAIDPKAYSVQPFNALHIAKFVNPFHATVLFLHTLKTLGNVCFSVAFG